MRRILGNAYVLIILCLLISAIGTIGFYLLAMLSFLYFGGLSLFGIGFSGTKDPVSLALALVFTCLTLTFPAITWGLFKRSPSIKSLDSKKRTVFSILFILFPILIYSGSAFISKLRIIQSDYQLARDDCLVKDGMNRFDSGENIREIECKNGIEDGAEILYNKDESTRSYAINHQGKTTHIYYQIPEKFIDPETSIENQRYLCSNHGSATLINYTYECVNGSLNGLLLKTDTRGNPVLKASFTSGTLNGTYETYEDGQLVNHLVFKDGVLDGLSASYRINKVVYQGTYKNGRQEGVFIRHNDDGEVESKVVFENGKIVTVLVP